MFVIIKNGGKQYKIEPGDVVKLESQNADKGNKLSLKNVIACNHDNKNLVGKPFLDNVEVHAEVLENKKAKKILVFKKRRRHNSRRLNGHRQLMTVVRINDVLLDGKSIKPKNIKKSTSEKLQEKKTIKQTKVSNKGVKNGS